MERPGGGSSLSPGPSPKTKQRIVRKAQQLPLAGSQTLSTSPAAASSRRNGQRATTSSSRVVPASPPARTEVAKARKKKKGDSESERSSSELRNEGRGFAEEDPMDCIVEARLPLQNFNGSPAELEPVKAGAVKAENEAMPPDTMAMAKVERAPSMSSDLAAGLGAAEAELASILEIIEASRAASFAELERSQSNVAVAEVAAVETEDAFARVEAVRSAASPSVSPAVIRRHARAGGQPTSSHSVLLAADCAITQEQEPLHPIAAVNQSAPGSATSTPSRLRRIDGSLAGSTTSTPSRIRRNDGSPCDDGSFRTDGSFRNDGSFNRRSSRRISISTEIVATTVSTDSSPSGSPMGARASADVMQPSPRQWHLDDLEEFGVLGHGTYGRVSLVGHRPSGSTYALKAMQKRSLIEMKRVAHVMRERELLVACCDHPFIVTLHGAFTDAANVYMLFEPALGGELLTLLGAEEKGRFREGQACFYAASVVAALSHMHSRSIAYRDLKPENLLLDKEGFLKICDFGFAKVIDGKTYTLCGTPEYLAPEVLKKCGHGLPVDWWALGILIFEMLTGDPPFCSDDMAPLFLYRCILRGTFTFPAYISKSARACISALLHANPRQRLGSTANSPLAAHPFFRRLDMTKLLARELPPPHVPELSGARDLSRFEEDENGNEPHPSVAAMREWAMTQPLDETEQQQFNGFWC